MNAMMGVVTSKCPVSVSYTHLDVYKRQALLQEMKEGGIEHAWIGLNSWEQAYGKPELVETAAVSYTHLYSDQRYR